MYGKIPDGVIETIKSTNVISKQMKELCAAHTPLQIHKTWDASEGFASQFMDLHETGDLLISPLVPDGEASINRADNVVVSYVHNNSRFEFDSWLVDLETDGRSVHRLARPLALRKLQVRRYHRIRFTDESSLPVSILRHGKSPFSLRGQVIDLGEGGMGSNVDSPAGLSVGMQVDRLLFALPDGYTIYAPATVRNIFPLHSADGELMSYRCGLEFAKLENRQRRVLAAFIFKKQQENIRRQGYSR